MNGRYLYAFHAREVVCECGAIAALAQTADRISVSAILKENGEPYIVRGDNLLPHSLPLFGKCVEGHEVAFAPDDMQLEVQAVHPSIVASLPLTVRHESH